MFLECHVYVSLLKGIRRWWWGIYSWEGGGGELIMEGGREGGVDEGGEH